MFRSINLFYIMLGVSMFFSSCKKDDGPDPATDQGTGTRTRYIVTATPIATTGVADYLLTTGDLSSGSISTVGNGIEQDGTYRYYTTHKGRFFSLLYGQGNPGAVTTYILNNEGNLEKVSDFQSETVQVFAPVGDDILTMKVPRSGNEYASMYRINADNSQIVGEKQINIVQLAGNGERAHFTWAKQVGNKVFAPYMSIKGCCSDNFGTSFPDSSWIAVFSYPDLSLEKVIKDNRTGSIGAYFTDGLAVDELGDVYAFSPAFVEYANPAIANNNPSAFVRIKAGTTEFDQTYFWNVQEASGGHHIDEQTYLGKGKFLLKMYGDKNPVTTTGAPLLAIADVYSKTFKWVSGLPVISTLSSPYNNNTVSEDGDYVYVGVNSASESRVYKIDIASATATPGLKVEGGKITSIVKMTY